jgi:hypothetical protein
MSTPERRALLRAALEAAGSSWLLKYWGKDQDRALDQTLQALDEFAAEYERRFRYRPDPFALPGQDPARGRAFFQADTLALSAEMKILVWRILLGCEIHRVEFHYESAGGTDLTVTLRTPYGEEEQYRGQQSRDFKVLRHFGATGVDNHLVLQGYYAPH